MFGGKSVQKDQEWPQELMGGDGSLVLLYQPQVESWKQYKLLRARMAVAFKTAIEAGRSAFEIGLAAQLDMADPTSPLTAFLD